MKSMTGHGISYWKSSDCYIEAIVQSYNSKHLELRLQVPPFYAALEGELRKEMHKKFSRGVINFLITRSPLWPAKQTTVQWNKKQALKWKALYSQMALSLKMEYKPDLLNLAQQPGVLEVLSQPSLVSASEKNKLKTLIRKAIEVCNKERVREGAAIKKDFQIHLKKLSLSIKKIKAHSVRQSKKARKNIEDKIDSIDFIKEKKTVYEVTGALINRMDTSEEISRMEEHIQAFCSLVVSNGVIGKKMSFYLQEMVREVNTIGSKSQDFKLTQEVVQTKSLIERMREQVQNVE